MYFLKRREDRITRSSRDGASGGGGEDPSMLVSPAKTSGEPQFASPHQVGYSELGEDHAQAERHRSPQHDLETPNRGGPRKRFRDEGDKNRGDEDQIEDFSDRLVTRLGPLLEASSPDPIPTSTKLNLEQKKLKEGKNSGETAEATPAKSNDGSIPSREHSPESVGDGSPDITAKFGSLDLGDVPDTDSLNAEGGKKISPDSPRRPLKVGPTKEIFVMTADATHEEINFFLNSALRASHSFGSKQGNHHIAYITLVYLVASCVEDHKESEAVERIKDVIKSILEDRVSVKLDEICEEFEKKLKEYFDRNSRKELTSFLRRYYPTAKEIVEKLDPFIKEGSQAQVLDLLTPLLFPVVENEEEITKLKNSLKLAEKRLMADFIASLGNFLLREINSSQGMAFASYSGEASSQGAQGSVVKLAIYSLNFINKITKIVNLRREIERKERSGEDCEEMKKEERILTERFMTRLKSKNSKHAQGLRGFLNFVEESKPKDHSTRKSSEIKLQLSEHEKALPRSSSLAKDFSNVDIFGLVDKGRYPNLVNYVGRAVNDLFDFSESAQYLELPPAIARNIVIVFKAFNDLAPLMRDRESRDKIMRTFIEKGILQDRKWQDKRAFKGISSLDDKYNKVMKDLTNYIDIDSITLYDTAKMTGKVPRKKVAATRKKGRGKAEGRVQASSLQGDSSTRREVSL